MYTLQAPLFTLHNDYELNICPLELDPARSHRELFADLITLFHPLTSHLTLSWTLMWALSGCGPLVRVSVRR